MNKYIKAMIIFIAVFVTTVFGYRVAKQLSYEWWYKDFIRQTVIEMVKPEYLYNQGE